MLRRPPALAALAHAALAPIALAPVALAGALALAPAAHAVETLEVLSGTTSPRAVNVRNGAIGQSFTAFTDTLTSVGFQFSTLNPGAANTPLTLQLFSGETLTGTALYTTTFSLPGTVVDRTPTWVDILLPDLEVTRDSLYSFVLTATSSRPAIVLGPGYSSPTGQFFGGDAYAGGKLLGNPGYANCTGPANNCDLNFRVSGNLVAAGVPEPGTWVMMIMGIGAIGAAMRLSRRRTPMAARFA